MVMKLASLMRISIALLLTLLFASGTLIQAQQSGHPSNPLTINTDLVITWANIFNKKDGSLAPGLEADDLLLREDGKPQRISLVKEEQPLSVVILVKGGYCGVWHPKWGFPRSLEALRQLGDDAEVALMGWEGDVVLTQSMTRDHKVIADQLEDRTFFLNAIARKQPQFFDNGYRFLPRPGEAVYQAARYLEHTAAPGRRKVIIALTYDDWTNETHLHTAAEVKEMLEKTGTTVYALHQGNGFSPGFNLTSRLGLSGEGKRRRSGGSIEEFVEQTGGSILFGKPEEGDDLLIKLTGLIRSSYTIGYYPENTDFDGKFRRIKLELSHSGKAKAGPVNIKTRSGYMASRPSSVAAAELPSGATIQTGQKEVQPNSVVILVRGTVHCCYEPTQLLTELSIPENRKALRLLGDDAEIALMAWDYDTALVQPMTRDQDLIAHRLKDKNTWINALRPRSVYPDGGAAEFARPGQAVYRAAQYLEQNAAPGRRKVIVVIDNFNGVDDFQPRTAAEVKEILEKTGTTVYGLYEDYFPENHAKYQQLIQKNKKERSGGTIDEFADHTGGTILVGKPEESDGLFIRLTGLIRSGRPPSGLSDIGRKSSSLH
jgi:VWFA-related protein